MSMERRLVLNRDIDGDVLGCLRVSSKTCTTVQRVGGQAGVRPSSTLQKDQRYSDTGCLYGLEHIGGLESSFERPESIECVRRVRSLSESNWNQFEETIEPFTVWATMNLLKDFDIVFEPLQLGAGLLGFNPPTILKRLSTFGISDEVGHLLQLEYDILEYIVIERLVQGGREKLKDHCLNIRGRAL
ncbi:hypothetical protein L1987_57371 [Smallanthus sonchifolius]|uniref:Uncharacterized protein n=1 Tax=Smallanthus sonchifolius TaxID=185202 RepID=A0ACB9DCB0_9ASTR|nr:hypothetical protein L1987_57371 [Smallanthus sonchifolius]